LCKAGRAPNPLEFPGRDVGVFVVVSLRLAVRRLIFLAEMSAARLAPLEGIKRQDFGEFHVVGNPPGIVEARIQVVGFGPVH
jgi:hypothetical protein